MAYDDPEKKIYHLCIVNLVIGLVFFSVVKLAYKFYFIEPIEI